MFVNKITLISRSNKQLAMVLADSLLVIAILFISFSFRLNVLFWPTDELFFIIFGSPIIAIPIFRWFGLYRIVIRFMSFKSLWSISQAVSLYVLVWGLVIFLGGIQILLQ